MHRAVCIMLCLLSFAATLSAKVVTDGAIVVIEPAAVAATNTSNNHILRARLIFNEAGAFADLTVHAPYASLARVLAPDSQNVDVGDALEIEIQLDQQPASDLVLMFQFTLNGRFHTISESYKANTSSEVTSLAIFAEDEPEYLKRRSEVMAGLNMYSPYDLEYGRQRTARERVAQTKSGTITALGLLR